LFASPPPANKIVAASFGANETFGDKSLRQDSKLASFAMI